MTYDNHIRSWHVLSTRQSGSREYSDPILVSASSVVGYIAITPMRNSGEKAETIFMDPFAIEDMINALKDAYEHTTGHSL